MIVITYSRVIKRPWATPCGCTWINLLALETTGWDKEDLDIKLVHSVNITINLGLRFSISS